jgi:hypothetical protein
MTTGPNRDIAAIIRDGTALDEAMTAAVRSVIERHRQTGIPLVVWQDGRIIELSADAAELTLEAFR